MSASDFPPDAGPQDPPETQIRPEDKQWAMLAHLSAVVSIALGGMAFLGPLIVWLVKKDQSKFVDDQGKEALNFQLTMLIATVVCALSVFAFVGVVLLPAVVVVNIVFSILAGVEANKGKTYRYPVALRFLK